MVLTLKQPSPLVSLVPGVITPMFVDTQSSAVTIGVPAPLILLTVRTFPVAGRLDPSLSVAVRMLVVMPSATTVPGFSLKVLLMLLVPAVTSKVILTV